MIVRVQPGVATFLCLFFCLHPTKTQMGSMSVNWQCEGFAASLLCAVTLLSASEEGDLLTALPAPVGGGVALSIPPVTLDGDDVLINSS